MENAMDSAEQITTNGAQALVKTLKAAGVEVCFTNPGTSEMHLLEALDCNQMRCVLGLHESVVTGAADGYSRLRRKPAATLLHLGPGLGNGLSNLHNAKRAGSGIINIVGDHASHHAPFDAPLSSDIVGLARVVSSWVRSSKNADELSLDALEAFHAAQVQPQEIATLIVPADAAWNETRQYIEPSTLTPRDAPAALAAPGVLEAITAAIRSDERCLLLAGGDLTAERLQVLGAIAGATACELYCDVFPTRIAHGSGTPALERLPYLPEIAIDVLKDYQHIILVDCKSPVAFFAYPNVPSSVLPQSCKVHRLCSQQHAVDLSLVHIAKNLAPDIGNSSPALCDGALPQLHSGDLTASAICSAVGALMLENSIIVDEGITGAVEAFTTTANSPPHEWIIQGGGAIGWGLPAGVGAAIACPERKVICLEGDGSGLYSAQAMWTMARENLNITIVIFANRDYAILKFEYLHAGATEMGKIAASQMTLGNPEIDYSALARAFGIKATQANTAEEFNEQFALAMKETGPVLIEAIYSSAF